MDGVFQMPSPIVTSDGSNKPSSCFLFDRRLFPAEFIRAADQVDSMLRQPAICNQLFHRTIAQFAIKGLQPAAVSAEQLQGMIRTVLSPLRVTTCIGTSAPTSIVQVVWSKSSSPVLCIPFQFLSCSEGEQQRCAVVLMVKLLHAIACLLTPLFYQLNGFPAATGQQVEAPLHCGTVLSSHTGRWSGHTGLGWEDLMLGGRLGVADGPHPYAQPLRVGVLTVNRREVACYELPDDHVMAMLSLLSAAAAADGSAKQVDLEALGIGNTLFGKKPAASPSSSPVPVQKTSRAMAVITPDQQHDDGKDDEQDPCSIASAPLRKRPLSACSGSISEGSQAMKREAEVAMKSTLCCYHLTKTNGTEATNSQGSAQTE